MITTLFNTSIYYLMLCLARADASCCFRCISRLFCNVVARTASKREVYTNCPATVSLPSLRSVTSTLSNLNLVAKNVIKGELLLIEFRHLPIPTIYWACCFYHLASSDVKNVVIVGRYRKHTTNRARENAIPCFTYLTCANAPVMLRTASANVSSSSHCTETWVNESKK